MTTELTLHGFCDSRVQALEQAFAANFHEGLEAGASLAMTLQGEPIVDLWAGFADAEETQPWQRDTVVQLFSNAKIMVTLCVLRLIDEGRIALDDPVAKHWPEFGAAGKEEITVREVLVHQARVPGFDPPVPLEDFANWERITALLAEQATWFPPGTSCYHPQTFGLILGELTRRVTGLMLSEFFAREFAQPLDADFQLGLKDKAQLRRTAELVPLDQPPSPSRDRSGSAFSRRR